MQYPEVEFVTFIVNSLVDTPNCFTVDRSLDERGVLLQLNIDRSEAGRVIGRKGSTAMSIRQMLRALGARNKAKYNLLIKERD